MPEEKHLKKITKGIVDAYLFGFPMSFLPDI